MTPDTFDYQCEGGKCGREGYGSFVAHLARQSVVHIPYPSKQYLQAAPDLVMAAGLKREPARSPQRLITFFGPRNTEGVIAELQLARRPMQKKITGAMDAR